MGTTHPEGQGRDDMAMQSLDDDSGVHVGCHSEHGRQVYSAVIRPAMTYAAAENAPRPVSFADPTLSLSERCILQRHA